MDAPLRNRLRTERSRLAWTQARTARAAGISRQAYSAVESGSAVPSTEVALRLARALGVPVEELFRLPDAPPELLRATWSGPGAAPGRRARLTRVAGRWIAHPAGGGERPSRPVDGVVEEVVGPVVGGGPEGVEDGGAPGRAVVVALLSQRPPPSGLAVAGCDPAFGIVAEVLRRERGVEATWVPRGSRASLEALARGEAHVAGIHLQDPRTGEPNGPWVRETVPFPCTRVAFAVWDQALLVLPGNPSGIGGVADLARPGVRFLNREEGSGSRMLLDEALAEAGVPGSRVEGYGTVARGHLAVAEAVASGLVDTGVAIVAAGAAFGLDVVPLRSEPYELVVPDHFLELPAVEALLDTLRRPGVRGQVEALGGYDGAGMGTPA